MPDSPSFLADTYILIQIEAESQWQDTLIALLGELPFEGFQEQSNHLEAYIREDAFDVAALENILASLRPKPFAYQLHKLPTQNWNQAWEAEYPPVEVDQFCQIVPHFHSPKPNFRYTIRITPQMSFGTGHHATTRLMIRLLGDLRPQKKDVLDMGSGTGVLGILTALQGASTVLGIDIDQWSMENGRDNILQNKVEAQMRMHLGDVSAIPAESSYQLILANINRNVLLQDLSTYVAHLRDEGHLLLSGFLVADKTRMEDAARQQGLILDQALEEDGWVALQFHKSDL